MVLRCRKNRPRKYGLPIISTANIISKRRTYPYAFTEKGIESLSIILRPKSDVAIKNVFSLKNHFENSNDTEKSRSEAIKYEIIKFDSGDILLDIRVSPTEDTIWLRQQDIAILFGTAIQNISMHISNIFADFEQEKKFSC